MEKHKMKVLYLSYNGMMEALGASQVLSYLYKLSPRYAYYLVSLEKEADLARKEEFEALKENLIRYNIHWAPLVYKSSKTGKLFNFFRFTAMSFYVVLRYGVRNLHVRSYLPATTARLIQLLVPIKYLFDTRGFTFDERFDIGSLRRGTLVHRTMKRLEANLYKNASGVNKLSHLGKQTILNDELFPGGHKLKDIAVIPTCVELDRFYFHERTYSDVVTIGYVGTPVGWYDFDKTLSTLKRIIAVRRVKFLVFNAGQHDFITSKLAEYAIPASMYAIEKVPFREMPKRLEEIDISLFFIHPYFSKKASAATKLGELFASGIPVLTNKDVGDHEYYILTYQAGMILDYDKIDDYDFNQILDSLLDGETSKRCREVAEKYFSLDIGVERYIELYSKTFKST